MLARNGPMHGHQIRPQAELERAEFWGSVKVSSLYVPLHRLEGESLIEALSRRADAQGRFPARGLSHHGGGLARAGRVRNACCRNMAVEPDPLALALSFSDDLGAGYLRSVSEERLAYFRTLAKLTTSSESLPRCAGMWRSWSAHPRARRTGAL